MLKRHLGWFSAPAGLLSVAALALGLVSANPARAGDEPGESETVKILDGSKAGDLSVVVRGQGEDRVKFTIKNKTTRRLNVIIPPGLVASAGLGQGGGGGGFQSMGLGVPTSSPGSFGAFRTSTTRDGFRSMPVAPTGLAVAPGQSIDLTVPSVCLNYGIATPTPKNVFRLMDVDDYSPDARVRKALKSLSMLGTGQGVAQAVMWHVSNGLSLDQLAHNGAKQLNPFELAQAARFIQALDASGSADLVEPAYFQQDRLIVRVVGEGLLAKDARRLNGALEGTYLLGLPARVLGEGIEGVDRPGTLLVNVALSSSKPGQTAARITLRHASAFGGWDAMGGTELREAKPLSELSGEAFAAALDRAIARGFVTASPVRRSAGVTTLKVVNRLPMTVANIRLTAAGAKEPVEVSGIGIGPMRSTTATVPAASAVVDRVELNGL